MEQSFFEHGSHFESEEDFSHKQKWKSSSIPASVSDNNGGCFDCNICLDSAQDPVVTLCGHLYCWPCIYKWLNVKSSSPDVEQQQQPSCPVCKASISPHSLVPLYGRGTSLSESESKKASPHVVVPRRPSPSGLNTLIMNASQQSRQHHPNFLPSQSQSFHHQQYFHDPYGGYSAMASSNLGNTMMTSFFNPMIGMFGELVFARIFGMSDSSLFSYPYQNSNSTRMRRQEMQLEKSLNRVTSFLLCCIILCLLLF